MCCFLYAMYNRVSFSIYCFGCLRPFEQVVVGLMVISKQTHLSKRMSLRGGFLVTLLGAMLSPMPFSKSLIDWGVATDWVRE